MFHQLDCHNRTKLLRQRFLLKRQHKQIIRTLREWSTEQDINEILTKCWSVTSKDLQSQRNFAVPSLRVESYKACFLGCCQVCLGDSSVVYTSIEKEGVAKNSRRSVARDEFEIVTVAAHRKNEGRYPLTSVRVTLNLDFTD